MKKADFKELYKWISSRNVIPTVSIFTPMQGSRVYEKYKEELIDKNVKKQDLFHCILKPKYMSVARFTYEYYKLSLKLGWKNRKSELYSCINFTAAIYILKVLIIKLKRCFVL